MAKAKKAVVKSADSMAEVVFSKDEMSELQRDRDTIAAGGLPHAARPIVLKLIDVADAVDAADGNEAPGGHLKQSLVGPGLPE